MQRKFQTLGSYQPSAEGGHRSSWISRISRTGEGIQTGTSKVDTVDIKSCMNLDKNLLTLW